MRIRILSARPIINARGSFSAGEVVDWPAYDAQPLLDLGQAEHAPEDPEHEAAFPPLPADPEEE